VKEAPLFIRAYDLHGWLLDRLEGDGVSHRVVRDTVLDHSRGLLAAVTLAVSRFNSEERLIDADEQATLLRVHLRLAAEKSLLDDRQLLYATTALRDIGRQIGGWRKRLEQVR
jgi:hypothetical protein